MPCVKRDGIGNPITRTENGYRELVTNTRIPLLRDRSTVESSSFSSIVIIGICPRVPVAGRFAGSKLVSFLCIPERYTRSNSTGCVYLSYFQLVSILYIATLRSLLQLVTGATVPLPANKCRTSVRFRNAIHFPNCVILLACVNWTKKIEVEQKFQRFFTNIFGLARY